MLHHHLATCQLARLSQSNGYSFCTSIRLSPRPLQPLHSHYYATSMAINGRWSRTSPYFERCSPWRERKGPRLIVKSDRSRWKQGLRCSQKHCLAHQLPRRLTRTFLTCHPVIIKQQNFGPILQLPVAATVPHSSPVTSARHKRHAISILAASPYLPQEYPRCLPPSSLSLQYAYMISSKESSAHRSV